LIAKTSHSGVLFRITLFSFQRPCRLATTCISYQTRPALSSTFFEVLFKRTGYPACRGTLPQQLV
ncbi:hypothetical protein, partial [Megasphaera stantonii]|uniref:hypothetical protein n=1 Tax=Megasphaera stantonii TaxID=2144175 RepID=UPI001D755B60